MNRASLIFGTTAGLTAVILGAFGAHALEAHLDADALDAFNTGVRYQMWHALLLVMLPLLSGKVKIMKATPGLFMVGVVLFSGSIYGLSCKTLLGLESVGWLGPVTPVGGLLIILGWGSLLVAAIRGDGV